MLRRKLDALIDEERRSPARASVENRAELARSTGSGKTVFLQAIALSLLDRPDCRLAIVDPKAVDFAAFAGPRLLRPVLTDAAEAADFLVDLCERELPARRERLRRLGVSERRQLPPRAEPMPAIVVLVDEFADLVMSFGDKSRRAGFVHTVQRLLQTARFAGIHLVLATQRPSVDAIPGPLKVNLNVRVAFQLTDAVNSKIILDEPGAEGLLGRGDLLLRRDGRTVRAQGYRVTPEDLRAAQGAT